MKSTRKGWNRTFGVVAILTVLVLGFTYAVADESLLGTSSGSGALHTLFKGMGTTTSSNDTSAGTAVVGFSSLGSGSGGLGAGTVGSSDVPNAVVEKIASSLGGVSGVDELVVLPTSASGVMVSAMVNLGDHSIPKTTWRPIVQADVEAFFPAVFGSQENVQMAQVYFTENGNVVAGAGLGERAYSNMAANASTGQSGFVAELKTSPMNTGNGMDESWYQSLSSSSIPAYESHGNG